MNKVQKLFSLFLPFLIFVSPLYAQISPAEKPSVFKKMEVRIGAGAFWHNSNPEINYKPERFSTFLGYSRGGWQLLFDLEFNDRFSISTGFKTASGDIFMDSTKYPATANLDSWTYIHYDFQEWEIPLRFRYYFGNGKLRPFVDGAISLNRFSRFTYRGITFRSFFAPEGEAFTEEGIPRNNASYDLGGGVHLDLSNNFSLLLDARYQLAELYWGPTKEIVMQRPVLGMAILWRLNESVWQE